MANRSAVQDRVSIARGSPSLCSARIMHDDPVAGPSGACCCFVNAVRATRRACARFCDQKTAACFCPPFALATVGKQNGISIPRRGDPRLRAVSQYRRLAPVAVALDANRVGNRERRFHGESGSRNQKRNNNPACHKVNIPARPPCDKT